MRVKLNKSDLESRCGHDGCQARANGMARKTFPVGVEVKLRRVFTLPNEGGNPILNLDWGQCITFLREINRHQSITGVRQPELWPL